MHHYHLIIRSILASELILSLPFLKIKSTLPQPTAIEILSVACCLASPVDPPLLSAKDRLKQLFKEHDSDEFEKMLRQAIDQDKAAKKIQVAVCGKQRR